MARVNKWKQFGDAFNAVYNAGTQLGAAIETGGIAMKDYEDEEGNKLTGLALDRAKMDDYAAVEQKYGDPLKALKMRTGVETLGQNRIRTDNLDADLKSIRGLRDAQTEFTGAKTSAMNLGTRIRQASETEEIGANKAAFTMETARDEGKTAAYNDPSYRAMLISGQEENAAESAANAVRFKSKEYTDYLKSKDMADNAENQERYVASNINRSIMETREYQTNYIASELAKMKRTYTMEMYKTKLAEDPATFEVMKNNLATSLNNSIIAVENSEVLKQLAQDPTVKANTLAAGLSASETAALDAENTLITARKSLQLNKFIEEWGKTSDPKDPTSMLTLIEGIKAIDPERGMALERNYGEHELWEITNNSLLMKAEANEAMATNGAEGVRAVLDKYNGDKLGVRLDKNKDGSFVLVETRNVGPGQTEIVRTIAQGEDEQSFMKDITAVLDPASLMEYSMNLADMKYKEALTMFSKAQAKAALAKKPLTMDQWATSVIQDKNATLFEKKLALAVTMKDGDPDTIKMFTDMLDVQSGLDGAQDLSVDPKVNNTPVDQDAPKTEAEALAAKAVVDILTDTNSTATQRNKALKGVNRDLVAKYAPDILLMEERKNEAINELIDQVVNGDLELTKDGLNELVTNFQSEETDDGAGLLSSNLAQKGKTAQVEKGNRIAAALSDPNSLNSILQIVLADLKSKADKGVSGIFSSSLKKRKIRNQVEELQALITELSQGR